jgi:hypothetical protein
MHKAVMKGPYSDTTRFEIKFMFSGCCGCTAIYGNIYEGKGLETQFIDEYKCGFGSPTKFVFKNNEAGDWLEVKGYLAVYDFSYTQPVTPADKQLFKSMDSLIQIQYPAIEKLPFASITGFRPQHPGERTHPFAIGKKNKAIHVSVQH